jgi:predicted component of type VI protein secretion system
MARLVLLSEGFAGRTYELKVDKTTVGRVSDNAFEIPESSVSSHHAEILLRGNDVLIRDLGSTNGTFINGEKITEAVLKPGQVLKFGTVEMRLDSGDGATPATASGGTGTANRPKQTLDQTRIIPQGVKLDELQGTAGPPQLGSTTGFEMKTNRGNKIFLAVVILLGLVLLCALAYVVLVVFNNAR